MQKIELSSLIFYWLIRVSSRKIEHTQVETWKRFCYNGIEFGKGSYLKNAGLQFVLGMLLARRGTD